MEEKEFDIAFILSAIRKRILIIMLFVILGATTAFLYNNYAKVLYESKTSLYVQPENSTSQVDYEGILTNQKLIKTYTEIIKSRKIIDQVKEKLTIKDSYEDISKMLTASSVNDTEIIIIKVVNENPKLAADIANETAKIFMNEIKSTIKVSNIRVIDKALVSKDKVAPREIFNMAIGIAIGSFIGLVIAILVESMDNKVKNHEDVKNYLKIKTLGVIPHNSIDQEVAGKNNKKTYVNPNQVNLKIINNPSSVISESIRMIRTNLNFSDLKLINITSTVPSEGKSEVIANLALSFAMLDKKVCIVDCDLRKPKIHKNFGAMRKSGVSDLVLSKTTHRHAPVIQRYTDPDKKVSIDILAAGSKISNPSELINDKQFAILLKELKEDYDLVLVDCPPISSLTDGVLVSKLCDGTIYVIESDRTDHQVIENCIDNLKNNGAFVLGAILTKVNIKDQKKLYGYKYDYYYSDYSK